MKIINKRLLLGVCLSLGLVGCESLPTKVDNTPGTPSNYVDPGTRGPISGVGIESQDIVGMTDEMVRDMLTVPELAKSSPAARVIVDAKFFKNESSQAINKNMIVDRLRVGLQRSAKGKIQFVNRERSDMVEQERQLKRAGKVDQATTGLTRAQAGADFRLSGRIASEDQRKADGQIQRYNMITFEMSDLETGMIIWTNNYEFSKHGQDDVIYR